MTNKGEQYEKDCESYLRQVYYSGTVRRTPVSNDGGKDIVVNNGNEKIFVECKDWSNTPVGRPVIQKLHSAVITEGANKGIIMTTGSFTEDAQKYIKEHNLPIELRVYRPPNKESKRDDWEHQPIQANNSYNSNSNQYYTPSGQRTTYRAQPYNENRKYVSPAEAERQKNITGATILAFLIPGAGFFVLYKVRKRLIYYPLGIFLLAISTVALFSLNDGAIFGTYFISVILTMIMISRESKNKPQKK